MAHCLTCKLGQCIAKLRKPTILLNQKRKKVNFWLAFELAPFTQNSPNVARHLKHVIRNFIA